MSHIVGKKPLSGILLIILAIITLFPFIMILLITFKSGSDFQNNPIGIPHEFYIKNYIYVFQKANIPLAYMNSFTITILSVVLVIMIGVSTAYALTKMKFKMAGFFSGVFLAPIVFPIFSLIVPLYLFFKPLHLINNFTGLILIYVASNLPLAILISTSFMRTIPYEINEAAQVDGASHLRICYQIIFPLLKPSMVTTFILTTLNVWNDFFLPLIMISKSSLATLPLKLYSFTGEFANDWPSISTCIIYLIVPIIIIYILLQRQIISGIVAGSVKG
jgi:raffinose/stachyose/melibiose transport system permease protein